MRDNLQAAYYFSNELSPAARLSTVAISVHSHPRRFARLSFPWEVTRYAPLPHPIAPGVPEAIDSVRETYVNQSLSPLCATITNQLDAYISPYSRWLQSLRQVIDERIIKFPLIHHDRLSNLA